MSKGTKYSQQFKEDAVQYRKDHPELPLRKAAENLGVSLNTVEKRKEIINGSNENITGIEKTDRKIPLRKRYGRNVSC